MTSYLIKTIKWADKNLRLIFVIPGILLVIIMFLYPIILTINTSFTDANLLVPDRAEFSGLQNYIWAFKDINFKNAIKVSIIWTFLGIIMQVILGVVCALALDRIHKYQTIFRVSIIIPWTFPVIGTCLTWKWMLDGRYGIINSFLISLGFIKMPIYWLSHPDTALICIILIAAWWGFPFIMLIVLAGLKIIPDSFYDVAKIEGANYFQVVRYIILPTIKKILGIAIILQTIGLFNNFAIPFISTGGGPLNKTQTLPVYGYVLTWSKMLLGKGSAINTMLLVIVILFVIMYFNVFRIDNKKRNW